MPNWCLNTLTIVGDEKVIDEICDLLQSKTEESPFTFENLLPRPEDIGDDWYAWSVANWGTKWDVSDASIHQNNNDVVYRFSTAWAPPEAFIETLSEK